MTSPVGANTNLPVIVINPEPVRKEGAPVAVRRDASAGQSASQQEDTVTLSSRQTPENASGGRTKPSLPVSAAEKKSLLGAKKSEHSFSVYG